MILPAQIIRKRCHLFNLVEPFVERGVIRGRSFGLSHAGYDVRIAEDHTLKPGDFALGSTLERFSMPYDLQAIVHDKSSWARRGLAVQNTVLEPGWNGFLTIELSNHSNETLEIRAGDPIAQIIFHVLLAPTELPYTGKYQDQESGPQSARDEKTL